MRLNIVYWTTGKESNMKKIILVILTSYTIAWGQLITSGPVGPSDLVQNTLVGYGIQLISVSSQGDSNAFGVFKSNGSNIGMEEGIIMTTGVISGQNGPVGPNNMSNSGMDNGTTGDFLLSTILPGNPSTFNAAAIEFTFIPSGDSIFLKYVFGSEEYPEYVGGQSTDVFGVFLNGPNPSGGSYSEQNIALVPNTTFPITINNINDLTNASYYVDNATGLSIQYDGFTKVLTARAAVISDTAYIIRIAIADVSDGIYDSGVFLEAFSFTSGTFIGIEETESEGPRMFPNPVNDKLQIRSDANIPIGNITITDISGRIVLNENIQSTSTQLDVSNLGSGMYTVTSVTEKGNYSKKIIVQ